MQSWRFYNRSRPIGKEEGGFFDIRDPSPHENASFPPPYLGCNSTEVDRGRKEDLETVIVGLEGTEDPQHWSLLKKLSVLAGLSLIAGTVTFSSSILAPSYPDISAAFDCSDQGRPLILMQSSCLLTLNAQVSYLGNSLYLLGFGLGALLFAPLSEMVGRQPVYTGGLFLFSLFQVGAATAGHWWTLAICRFFAGFFGSPPLSNGGGSLADMFSSVSRTWAFPIFAMSGFWPPTMAPTIGAFISSSAGGWRWSMWLCSFLGLFTTAIGLLLLPETYKPALLELKAASLNAQHQTRRFKSPRFAKTGRKATFDWRILPRALQMLVTEPIVFFLTLYLTIVYFILYADLESYPLIFVQWQFTTNQIGLTFLSQVVGVILTGAATPLVYLDYMRRRRQVNQQISGVDQTKEMVSPPPEARLIQLCWACWLLPLGMFWLGFTTVPSISPWPASVAGVPFGSGLLFTFISSYEYIIDAYGPASASALAATTFVRYVVCCGLIHATTPMYEQLTLRGGFALLGGVSLAMCTVPFLLVRYGRRIRARSSFAAALEKKPEMMAGREG